MMVVILHVMNLKKAVSLVLDIAQIQYGDVRGKNAMMAWDYRRHKRILVAVMTRVWRRGQKMISGRHFSLAFQVVWPTFVIMYASSLSIFFPFLASYVRPMRPPISVVQTIVVPLDHFIFYISPF